MFAVEIALVFLLAMLIGVYGTPIAIRVAHDYKILDFPDQKLKKQKQPVAYLGGLIIYFAAIFPLSLLIDFNQQFLGIVFSSLILLIIGLFDDLKAMTPRIKFLFQMIAAYILIKSGIFINLIYLPEWLNAFGSFFWILTMINAFNIIDVHDGFAGITALLGLLAIFFIALINGFNLIAVFAVALIGALTAFLIFNFPPARIYLGDAGSMVLGMLLGTFVIILDYSKFNSFGFFSAPLIVAIPLFDLAYVVILRLMKKKSPFQGSPDHIALRLLRKFNGNKKKVLIVCGLIQLLLSLAAVGNLFFKPLHSVLLLIAVIFFFLIFGLLLKRYEEETVTQSRL